MRSVTGKRAIPGGAAGPEERLARFLEPLAEGHEAGRAVTRLLRTKAGVSRRLREARAELARLEAWEASVDASLGEALDGLPVPEAALPGRPRRVAPRP